MPENHRVTVDFSYLGEINGRATEGKHHNCLWISCWKNCSVNSVQPQMLHNVCLHRYSLSDGKRRRSCVSCYCASQWRLPQIQDQTGRSDRPQKPTGVNRAIWLERGTGEESWHTLRRNADAAETPHVVSSRSASRLLSGVGGGGRVSQGEAAQHQVNSLPAATNQSDSDIQGCCFSTCPVKAGWSCGDPHVVTWSLFFWNLDSAHFQSCNFS